LLFLILGFENRHRKVTRKAIFQSYWESENRFSALAPKQVTGKNRRLWIFSHLFKKIDSDVGPPKRLSLFLLLGKLSGKLPIGAYLICQVY